MVYRGQAHSPSSDLAPPPPPPPLSRQKVVLSSCVSSVELTDGRGGKGVKEPNYTIGEKALYSINHLILPGEGYSRTSKNTKLSLSEPVRLSAARSFEREKSGSACSF
jgi:hypothetical protein